MHLKVLQPDEQQQAPWYSKGLRFTCTECGNCCTGGPGYVWISRKEIDRLAEHLKLPVEEVIQQYCRTIGGRYSLNERRNAQGNYDCVFLKEIPAAPNTGQPEQVVQSRRICGVYPVRPLQCRTWPFWTGTLANREIWDQAAQRCPGINTGRTWSRQEIEALRDAKRWPKDPPTSSSPPETRE